MWRGPMSQEVPRRRAARRRQDGQRHPHSDELPSQRGLWIGGTRGCRVNCRAQGCLEDGFPAAMRTTNVFAQPAGGEFDMAGAVLAGALKMSLRFRHELPLLYTATRPVNKENCAIEAGSLQLPRRGFICCPGLNSPSVPPGLPTSRPSIPGVPRAGQRAVWTAWAWSHFFPTCPRSGA